MTRFAACVLCVVVLVPLQLFAQSPDPAADDDGFKLRLSGELKVNGRWSEDDRFVPAFPFPPDFVPVGQPNVALRTVSPGTSLEVSRALVNLGVELPAASPGTSRWA